nr:MAG TPA: putative transcriptional regulator [Caudoviricetes sp.]
MKCPLCLLMGLHGALPWILSSWIIETPKRERDT